MIELKNSKTTYLGKKDGRNRFAVDCHIGAIQMLLDGVWQDIKPKLVKDAEGWHAEGTPYALNILDDGTRRVYPDRTDLNKYLYLPAPAMLRGLKKRIEGNKLIFYTPAFDIIYQLTNTGVQFQILMRVPIPFDRITLDAEAVGFDIKQLLKAKQGLGIPRPRLIDVDDTERWLDWSYKKDQLELGFDLSGLRFPILLKNTTINLQVGASVDDAHSSTTTDTGSAYAGATVNFGGAALYFMHWRWQPEIESGMTIDNGCYIRPKAAADDADSNAGTLEVYDERDCEDYTNDKRNDTRISGKSVAWTVGPITEDATYDSPEIKELVQAWVDLPGHLTTDHIGFQLSTSNADYLYKCAKTWDYLANDEGAYLHIEYTAVVAKPRSHGYIFG